MDFIKAVNDICDVYTTKDPERGFIIQPRNPLAYSDAISYLQLLQKTMYYAQEYNKSMNELTESMNKDVA